MGAITCVFFRKREREILISHPQQNILNIFFFRNAKKVDCDLQSCAIKNVADNIEMSAKSIKPVRLVLCGGECRCSLCYCIRCCLCYGGSSQLSELPQNVVISWSDRSTRYIQRICNSREYTSGKYAKSCVGVQLGFLCSTGNRKSSFSLSSR